MAPVDGDDADLTFIDQEEEKSSSNSSQLDESTPQGVAQRLKQRKDQHNRPNYNEEIHERYPGHPLHKRYSLPRRK